MFHFSGEEVAMVDIPIFKANAHTACLPGLLTRKVNDWKAIEELTANLRESDPEDPVKYDFALFGLGAIGNFNFTSLKFW